ncbi:hypothetical protein GCM10023115_28420 [Pontixanthobacter gangjinensis]|uniref:histidine kinase n=1 Tax=Christiangramia aestuarii TaxID=1028746 RepID=A0A7K1LMN6_9FLAO|nr:ATP-binding protein [Christiangramia aestuarii]MUP42074.1 hypothetical protein [Christiangramia aestuarii]
MSITQKQKDEVLSIYQKWLDSYLNGDIYTYDSYFDDDYHFIGSTNNEEFLNRKDTTEFFRKTTDQFAGKTDLRNNITTIEKFGDIIFLTHLFDAWFMAEGNWTYYGRFRFSNALHETNKGWKFIYQHFSLPDAKTEEGETIGFDQISSENLQLREAIQRRTKELEEKSRELQVEMALEKVRAKSLEMQHTSELQDVIKRVHRELLKLELPITGGAFIIINSDIQDELWCWGAGGTADYVQKVHVPPIDKPIYQNLIKGIKKGAGFFTEEFSQAEKIEFFEHLFKFPPYLNADEAHKKEVFSRQGGYTRSCAVFKNTSIFIINHHGRIFTEHENNVLKRFGSVFEQAYTRFLDLKKAEAQTREAQIETALERVRSRTMFMQHSKELPEAANILFLEIEKLGIPAWSAGYNILSEDRRSSTCIMSSEGELQEPFVLPLTEHESLLPWHEAIVRNVDFFVYGQEGEDLVEHYDYMTSLPELKKTFEQFQEAGLDLPKRQFNHLVRFNKGFLLFITYEEVPEAHDIFKRFGKVFEQTYTRFLDLQKAEKQAREAEINLALERIRAATMAMHNTEEIGNTVITFFQELRGLGLPESTRCGIGILSQSEHMQLYTASTKKGHHAKLTTVNLDMSLHPLLVGVKRAWEKGEAAFSYELKGVDKFKYFDRLNKVREYPVNIDLETLSEIVYHFSFPFKDGVLFVFLDEPLTSEYEEICKRFARSFSLTYTRFLDLQKAENQAREAHIEAALERVRSRTMGMQKSSELEEVIKVVFDQLVHLNFNIEHAGFIIDYKENDDMHIWLTDKNKVPAEVTVPYIDTPHWNSFLKAKKNGDNFFSNLYTFEEKNKFYRELFEIIPGVDEETKSHYQNCKGLAISTVLMDDVGLYIENFEGELFSEEENKTLLRFGKVFQQTYTRFRDLENAEAQTKQAQIEAALERVRSRSMGMQNSKDFSSVTTEMFNQLRNFGGDLFATGIVFCDKHKDHVEQWHSIPGAGMMSPFIVPKDLDYIHEYRYNQWKKGEELFSIEIPEDFIEKHFQDIFNLPSAQKVLKDLEENDTPMPGAPPWEIDYGASFKNGYILVSALQVFEEAHILPRFAKVFEQAYIRYLDLKKAELQAREAQVEAALERIRSRSIGMQKSEDLADLSLELVKQVQELGVSTWFCAFNIYDDDERGSVEWGSNGQGVFPKYRTPREGVFLKYYEAGQQGQSLLVNEIGEDECPAHYEYLCSLPGVGDQLLQMKAEGISFPTSQIDHVAFFKYGYLIFITYEPVPESYEIFKRFARVFEQSYTRFLDLQKAEERAREARVETALEKVRSRTLAMERSKEFTETSMVVFEQLLELGISPNRLFIGLIDSDLDTIDAWATNEDGSRLANHFKLEASKNRSIARMLDGWKQGKTSQIIDMEGRELQDYFKYLNEELKIPFQGGVEQKRRIQYMAYFSGGLIGLASGEEQDEDALELLERFAAVFNLTYIRFKDLKVAEANAIKARQDLKEIKAARENAEKALTELQQTQKQLIQSEKMASLGELTAGIAHEIQNPLNFVNNFSEVSNELLDEIAEEIEKGDLEEVKEILKDIRNNLNKINHHGKRADAIVKGMLQHSRKGNSEIEPTDLNILCDEYLRLAYHGLRAKDKSFNASLETDFDPGLGNIPVMAQEIGRVILNLLTNAFYAVLQKRNNSSDALYEPKVSISTHKEANQVLIRVKDNGCGIPKKNLDKIFQPFFTTKPTGQGTGLGLSLSYDIVKAHGGVLEVETQKGKGTTFTIIIKTNR